MATRFEYSIYFRWRRALQCAYKLDSQSHYLEARGMMNRTTPAVQIFGNGLLNVNHV